MDLTGLFCKKSIVGPAASGRFNTPMTQKTIVLESTGPGTFVRVTIEVVDDSVLPTCTVGSQYEVVVS